MPNSTTEVGGDMPVTEPEANLTKPKNPWRGHAVAHCNQDGVFIDEMVTDAGDPKDCPFPRFRGHGTMGIQVPGPNGEPMRQEMPYTYGIDAVGIDEAFEKADEAAQAAAQEELRKLNERAKKARERAATRIQVPGQDFPAGGAIPKG